jgi:hypothetical protein
LIGGNFQRDIGLLLIVKIGRPRSSGPLLGRLD